VGWGKKIRAKQKNREKKFVQGKKFEKNIRARTIKNSYTKWGQKKIRARRKFPSLF